MTRDEATHIQNVFANWAMGEPSCRALAVVGSWARGTARIDSDLDIILLANEPDRFSGNDAWLRDLVHRLGFPVMRLEAEAYGAARSWRVWLSAGIELEVTLVDIGWANTGPVDGGTRRVIGDGMRRLVDKDGLLEAVQAAVG